MAKYKPPKGVYKPDKMEINERCNKLYEMICHGFRRQDCILYAADAWGVSERTTDKYLKVAREKLKKDLDIDKSELIATLIAQTQVIQREAKDSKNYCVAVGCINTIAKIARITT